MCRYPLGADPAAFLGRTAACASPLIWRKGLQDDCLIDFTRPEGTLAHLKGVRTAGREAGHRRRGLPMRRTKTTDAAHSVWRWSYLPNMVWA